MKSAVEGRYNTLWGRGGRRAGAVVAAVVTACTLAASAAAGVSGGHTKWAFNVRGLGQTSAYVPDSLASQIQQTPNKKFDVIVEGAKQSAGSGLKNSLLNARHGSNAIGGLQIRRTFHAINGVHAMLTGAQIGFLAKTSFRLGDRPERPGEAELDRSAAVQRAEVGLGRRCGRRLDDAGGVADGADDRRGRLRDRLVARRLRLAAARPGEPGEPLAELARRRIRARHLRGRSRRGPGVRLRRRGAEREPRLRRRDERPGRGDRRRHRRGLRLDPPEQGAVQHPRRQLLAARDGSREPVLRSARPGGGEAVAERRRRGHRGRQLRRQRCRERRPVRSRQRPVRDHRRRVRRQDTARPATTRSPRGRPGATRRTAS